MLVDAATTTLQQAIELVGSLRENEYTRVSEMVPESSVGKHVRHVIDHYRIFLDALPNGPQDTVIVVNYDKRARSPAIEGSPSVAIEALRDLQRVIRAKFGGALSLNASCGLVATVSTGQSGNRQGSLKQEDTQVVSSLGRELWYCCMHAIHHYALIKVICIEIGHPAPQHFGVAPSTLQYQATQQNA
ncbi:hypothetical protein BZG36_01710 [Bifiguratus adelaidae]|uniref:DinB-like domain-containing protein n=1 Tax=Bifiguratus adelaidae TaxID=1938954 RepID=A0A261Y4M6_9FUNG|nr:hypothetical protein BZG36_01710 [Bifiguratus adelaidae]